MAKGNLIALSWMWLCAAAIIGMCWWGIAKEYNPIPYWDMWDGTVAFLINFSQGSGAERFASLFDQHNEHRIAWSKLLFLADSALFNSSYVLLFVFNALIPFLAVWAVTQCAAGQERHVRWAIAAISCCFLFLLIQIENFGWAFQSQFFLACFVPLLGYYCAIRFWSENQMRNAAVIALAALASAFTMANGALFAFPLAMLFVCQKQTRVTGLLAGAVLVCILALYLKVLPYQSQAHHGDLRQSVLNDIVGYVDFIVHYFGAPFGGTSTIHRLFGLFFMVMSLRHFWRAIRRDSLIDLRNVLLLYIMYYIMTVAVTGIGRASFGVGQALSDRYSTPTLLAWLCLLVLALLHGTSQRWHRIVYLGCLPFLALLGLGIQIDELDKAGKSGSSRTVAHLALHLKAEDEDAIKQVYPVADKAIALYAESTAFGMQFTIPRDSWTALGTQVRATSQCEGQISEVVALPDGTTKITGWIVNPGSTAQTPTPVAVRDSVVIGIGHRGQAVPQAENAGFVVYLPQQDARPSTFIHSSANEDACILPV